MIIFFISFLVLISKVYVTLTWFIFIYIYIFKERSIIVLILIAFQRADKRAEFSGCILYATIIKYLDGKVRIV